MPYNAEPLPPRPVILTIQAASAKIRDLDVPNYFRKFHAVDAVQKPSPNSHSFRRLSWVLTSLILLALSASPALGQSSEEQGSVQTQEEDQWAPIRVYQQRPFMRKLRVEITPTFGMSVNDIYQMHLSTGGSLNVHVTNELSVGASYHKYFRVRLPLADEVEDEFGVFPEHRQRDFYVGGHLAYAPVYGKFMLFHSGIIHFDAYLVAGGGMMRTFQRGSEGDNLFSFNAGLGTRMVLSQWCTFLVELRDYMYFEPYRSGDSFVSDIVLQVGLSLFLPPHFDYRYVK